MRYLVLPVMVCCALAFAGTRARDSSAPPSAVTDGVSLSEVQGCRASVRIDGGGTISTGGKMVLSYYDAVLGWVESDSTLNYTVPITSADGGTRTSYVSPDIQPVANFGRIAVHTFGTLGSDGGTAATGTVKARIECWGPSLP